MGFIIHKWSEDISGGDPLFLSAGHSFTRREHLLFGAGVLPGISAHPRERSDAKKLSAILSGAEYPVRNGYPVPSIVFSCVTFPFRWSSERKLSLVEAVLNSRGMGMTAFGSGEENILEDVRETIGVRSERKGSENYSPEEPPWGAFCLWCDTGASSGLYEESGTSFVQAGFASGKEIAGNLDVLLDIKNVRNDRFWNKATTREGKEPSVLTVFLYSLDDLMWGTAADILLP